MEQGYESWGPAQLSLTLVSSWTRAEAVQPLDKDKEEDVGFIRIVVQAEHEEGRIEGKAKSRRDQRRAK